jgi:hypothetical protein
MNSGLCSSCAHARKIVSDRGSEFLLCALSAVDERYPKYPRLPVLSCPGYLTASCSSIGSEQQP